MLLNPKYAHLRDWLERLPEEFSRLGEVIYDKRNQLRVVTAPDGTVVNIKRYRTPRQPNRLVYSLGIRQPKGLRAFRYPSRLLERGIDTPEPIAYIEQRHWGMLGECYFVSVQSPLCHTLYEAGNAAEGTYEALADALGRFTAAMHESEVLHLDYSPGNILWDTDEQGRYRFAVVDINRMRFGKVNMEDGCQALCRLWGPKRFIELVARSYAAARGYDTARAVELTMQARVKFWTRYRRRHPVEFDLEL